MKEPKVVCLDCETTGLDRSTDYIIDICIRDFHTEETKLWRVCPPKPIPPEITAIHGITDEMVKDSPSFGVISDQLKEFIESIDVVIGYNPDFDMDMLKAEFIRAGWNDVKYPKIVVCAKRLWNTHMPPLKRNLQAAYMEFVDAKGFSGAHTAIADVCATIEVFKRQREIFNLTNTPWAELDPERLKWVGSSDHFIWRCSYRDNIIVNFGKSKGLSLMECDRGYFSWIMKNEFPPHVKKLVDKAIIFSVLPLPAATKAIADWAQVNI